MKRVFFLILAVILFASCEVEFSPNDEWREIPVVYCLLDQQEDTTFVRLERCFLGEGNQRNYISIPDSLYFPKGAVKVLMEEWALKSNGEVNGTVPRRVFDFDYMGSSNKEDGEFYSGEMPLYICRTAGQLDSNCLYRLRVVKTTTGDTIVKGETRLVYGEMNLVHPNNTQSFQFSGSSKDCLMEWTSMSEARQYQPIVRFRYRDFIVNYDHTPVDTTINYHYIDIPGNIVKSSLTERVLSTRMEMNYFLSTIKNNITDVDVPKNIIDTVDIFIVSCTEPLAAYLYANHPAGGISQEPFEYTNIEGGLGVFAARRRHVSFKITTPNSSVSLYIRSLKELNVGF